jgi:hypothetical protein
VEPVGLSKMDAVSLANRLGMDMGAARLEHALSVIA